MDFRLAPSMIAYREKVRSIIAVHHTPDTEHQQHTTGTFNNPALNRALAAEGLVERAVPGLGAGDPIELWVLFNEMEKAGAPLDALAMAVMPVLGACNGVSDAELVWCQSNADKVAAAAKTLGMPVPETAKSWDEWAAVVSYPGLKGLWDGATIESDRPNRDRACKAAYESR
jgi:hypothetical protein